MNVSDAICYVKGRVKVSKHGLANTYSVEYGGDTYSVKITPGDESKKYAEIMLARKIELVSANE